MKIERELLIEAFQNFNKYKKLDPIDIEITDPEVMRKLSVYQNRRIKYCFIANSV